MAFEFVQHLSAISRLLWPSVNKENKNWRAINNRCENLRKNLGIEQSHRLVKRTLRNHLVHFDEMLLMGNKFYSA